MSTEQTPQKEIKPEKCNYGKRVLALEKQVAKLTAEIAVLRAVLRRTR
jgi:hypothetical protein